MAVNLSPVGGVAAQFFDNSGNPLSGGKLYSYLAGTTTPATTYTSSNGSTAHSNPIVLDAAGRVPAGGEIWLTDGINYKFVLKTSTDTLIATYDNITGINSNFVSFTNQQEIATATAGQTVFNLGITYQPGTNSLSVFVDGVNQYGPGAQYSYVETDANTVTFNNGLHVGASVKFTTSQQQGAGAVDASQVTYDPPFTGAVATNVEVKLSQTVSVLDFGAVGDGVADDSSAIQTALNQAAGKALWVPAGYTFACGARLQIPSNTYLCGNGVLKALPLGTSASIEGFLYGASLANVTIDGVQIDCNPSAQTHPLLTAIRFTASSDVTVKNCQVTCSYAGVYIRSGSNSVAVTNNNIDNSYGSSTDAALRHGPSIIVGADNAIIANNYIKGITSTAVADSDIATGIVAGADGTTVYTNVSVTGNVVNASYSAYALTYINGAAITGNAAYNCLTKNHSQGFIATSCNAIVVDGNTFRNIDYTGIALVDCQDSTVSNNIVSNDTTFYIGAGSNGAKTANGITVSQTGAGKSKNNTICDNHIGVNGVTSGTSYKSLLVYGDKNVIEGNSVQATTAGITSYGLDFTGAKCVISNNLFDVTYTAVSVSDVGGWTTCQYNVIDNNSVSTSGTYSLIDSSTGPNRYMLNHWFSGATSYTNSHYIANGNLQRAIVNKAADYTIQLSDCDKILTNGGATGTVVLTLPTAVASGSYVPYGLSFEFNQTNANTFRIEPNGTDIIGAGNAGKYMELTNKTAVKITCLTSGVWALEFLNGSVSYEP